MKTMKFIFVMSMLIGITNIGRADDNELHFNTSFDPADLKISTIEKEGIPYTDITIDGLNNSGEPGHPSMPVKVLKFSIPAEAVEVKVEAVVTKSKDIVIQHPPVPAQYPAIASVDYQESPFIHLLSSEAKVDEDLSGIRATVGEVFTVGGFNKVAEVLINPVHWKSSAQSLDMATELTLILSWVSDSDELERLSVPRIRAVQEDAMRRTEAIVTNPDDVEDNSMLANTRSYSVMAVSPSNHIPYVIVTTKALAPSLERLAAFRRLRGFKTIIYTIEDILSNSKYAKGDVLSGLTDEAGRLRVFIAYMRTLYGAQYILLAGPSSVIPGRWATYYTHDAEGNRVAENYISDQYLRDLTTKWTIPSVDYTRPDELSGISQDICVARLSLNTPKELDNYMDKLIQYEFNLKDIDLSYLDNAFVMLGSDPILHSDFEEYSLRYYQQYFKNLGSFFVPPIDERIVYGKEVINAMRSDNWGFVDWRGHGHYAGVSTSQNDGVWAYGLNALDSHRGNLREESGNGLDSWGNRDYPCWTLSMSCNLAEIGYGRNTYNFAESFVLGKDYGGVAFIGNSGPGLIGDSSLLIQTMLDQVDSCYSSKFNIPYTGDIFMDGLRKTSTRHKHTKVTVGITGDPLTPLWLKSPAPSSVNGKFRPSFIRNSDSVNFSIYSFTNGNTQTGHGLVSSYVGIKETKNSTVLNTRTDMVPYIHPTGITSLTINENGYWFTGKLRFYSSGSEYALRLTDNKTLIIEPLGNVEIAGRLVMDHGSGLRLLTHKPVVMNNCCFESEGSVTVDAHRIVEIGTGTTISKGMKLTINNLKDE